MRSKLNYLIKVSLMRKIKTKWFLIANLLLLLGIVAVSNMDKIISSFGGDFTEAQKIYVIDNTKGSYELFKNQMEVTTSATGDETKYDFKLSGKDEKEMRKEIKKEPGSLLIVFDEDPDAVLAVKLISEQYLDILDNQFLTNSIYNTKVLLAIDASSINKEELDKIYAPVNVERVLLDETKKSDEENMEVIMGTVFPIVILPFFMLVVYLVQMIGAEINDEKTTRGMEIIISNVSPKTHFFSKVISSNLFILMQGLLFFIYGAIGFGVRNIIGGSKSELDALGSIKTALSSMMSSQFVDKLVYIIPLSLLLMVITFLAYSLLAGILASMTTNTEDFQQIQAPIMIVLLLGYYLAIMSSMFKGAIFIKVLSYIPFISAILSPSLLVLGQIGIIDVLISIVLTIVVNYVLIKYGLKIYKVGILNYSSEKLWKKMFKALKN